MDPMGTSETSILVTPVDSGTRRRKLLLFKVVAPATALALSALVAELVLRTDYFLYRSSKRTYVPTHKLGETGFFKLTGDPALPYRMPANVSERFWWNADYTTNEYGYLGDSRSEPGRLNILCAGDSVTFGLGVQQRQVYPEILREAVPKARISVLAAPGYNTVNEVAWIRQVVEESRFQPEIVILQFGPNDYLHPTRVVRTDRYYFYERVPTRTLGQPTGGVYKALLDSSELFFRLNDALSRSLNGAVELHDYPDRIGLVRDSLSQLGELADARGFVVILLKVPYYEETSAESKFADKLTPSTSHADHFLDLTSELKGKKQLWFNRMHPNQAGHRRIAEVLAEYLVSRDLLSPDGSPR